jgi:two-component system chemotaxis response regulator CheY
MARIMTVDDSPSIRKLVAATMERNSHEVHQAATGVEALALAKKVVFHVIISDVNMPEMDGLTLLKAVRSLPSYKFTPFLLLTTEMDPAKKKQAKEAGATGWLVKPFNPEQLIATVGRVLD